MNARLAASCSLAALTLVWASPALATYVRGRVDYGSQTGFYPMAGAFVRLCISQTPTCADYVTGYDGMYYLNVQPGLHDLYINDRFITQISVPPVPNFDIEPMLGQ